MRSWIIFALCGLALNAGAEEELQLHQAGATTDLPTLERGAETVMTVCLGCHSLKYIRFRELEKLGIAKDKVDGWRGSNPMGTAISSQMPAEAAMASFGKAPPDLSLMAKAREGGPDYIYSYLLGYYNTPEGGLGNHYYPPTKMPDVLGVAGVTDPAQRAELEKKAREVVSFLDWAADPRAQERHTLGYYVIAYLVLLTTLLYFLKRRVWGQLDKT
ncbi:MAG: cytochrome C [Nitrosomonadales bacterium]|nr:cytochrome C [Nitrosomonadales bacterium]